MLLTFDLQLTIIKIVFIFLMYCAYYYVHSHSVHC